MKMFKIDPSEAPKPRFAAIIVPAATPPKELRSGRRATRPDNVNPTATYPVALHPDGIGSTFADRACEFYEIKPRRFEEFVLRRCLYRKAWLFRPFLQYFDRNFFAPDREFVRRIANIRHREELMRELDEFFYHPRNTEWMRYRLRLRISSRRLVYMIREVMPDLRAPGSVKYGEFQAFDGDKPDTNFPFNTGPRN